MVRFDILMLLTCAVDMEYLVLFLKIFYFSDIEQAVSLITRFNLYNADDQTINTIGVGSLVYKDRIQSALGSAIRVCNYDEMTA